MGSIEIEQILGVDELRSRALKHTRKAFELLPAFVRPRILDLGCGQGQQTIELARLSGGNVLGIDIDESALLNFRKRIEQSGLSNRVTAHKLSLFDSRLPAESFDILWEEGVMHLLDPERSFATCRNLVQPMGFLVMHEQLKWFEQVREQIPGWGWVFADQHLLPKHFWWTNYGAPLQERIRAVRESQVDSAESPALIRYVNEAAMIKADPDQFDCGFFIFQIRK
jgi:cyclopropane fatty-acyl-phospholipid synthase-like methyltransferase